MCIFIVRVYCICIWLCFGVRQRDRKWVVCGGDSSLEGLSGSPCSSDMILAVPPPATLLLFYPLHPFTCFRASQHRQRTLLNISQRYHSSPPLQNRDVLVFAQYRISVFLASLPAVCTSHVLCKKVLTVAQSTIMGEAWTSDHLLLPSGFLSGLCACTLPSEHKDDSTFRLTTDMMTVLCNCAHKHWQVRHACETAHTCSLTQAHTLQHCFTMTNTVDGDTDCLLERKCQNAMST